ncbi:gliding motility-associated C-terminal domain-containing protein [Adhaeribacter soli]|uniref:Gliding motility-associated C-terminal domain-containing protein n=1 Tax=Adhaeribacter soli TaxID=2607655 RepID=A0A5N1J0Y0_9BACT|nr:gliding motility-associated C-terminal domain-containing protein [Adhaeribacter soli]KAA9340300.1 gliding motility-associated C-terminal domain-containing protein [Adhaeribacter soli]
MITLNLLRLLLVFSCFIFIVQNSYGQFKEGANWLFGTKIHLDFNSPKTKVDSFFFNSTVAVGVATISDKNGNLLFFSSNGRVATRQKVNGAYKEMPNGDLVSATPNQGTWAEMIVQSPADSNIYYLFYTTGDLQLPIPYPALFCVQIDMRLNNGYGDVVPGSKHLLRRNAGNFKLTALLHSNNRDTWILAPNYTNDSISAFLLTSGGIMAGVTTKSAKPLSYISRMKASPNSEMLVIGGYNPHGAVESLEVFDFNRTTGVPTHKYSLPSPDSRYPFFSYAFSPDNSKLYTGTIGDATNPLNATLFQYDLAAGSALQIEQSRNVIFNRANYSGIFDIQLAIDGKLYLLIDSAYLSQISCPNFYGAASRFKLKGVKLTAVSGGGTLPALNQTIFRNADKLQAQAYRNTICEGDTVQLSAYGAGAEQFRWKPANGLISPADTSANPVVNPTSTTTYKVIGSSTCRTDTAYVKVTVLPKPKPLVMSGSQQVHTFAEKQQYLVHNQTAGNSYYWEVTGGTIASGQGQASILVNWGDEGAGVVSVTESNAAGCKRVTKLPVQISGEPDLIIYNILTPNNDGKNDAFVIENLKWYPQNELRIFNRWGKEVYQSKNYLNNWKAEKVSAGIYYYLFTVNGKAWKGWVEVVK